MEELTAGKSKRIRQIIFDETVKECRQHPDTQHWFSEICGELGLKPGINFAEMFGIVAIMEKMQGEMLDMEIEKQKAAQSKNG